MHRYGSSDYLILSRSCFAPSNLPLGDDVKDRKLITNPAEAETVRLIFQRYAELGSVKLLQAELDRRGLRSKRREGAKGLITGGVKLSRGISCI
jgi:site-specific DNA recombinase